MGACEKFIKKYICYSKCTFSKIVSYAHKKVNVFGQNKNFIT